MKPNLRLIFTIASFFLVFLGILSLVGNVHVAEFFTALVLAVITAIIMWFKSAELVKKL